MLEAPRERMPIVGVKYHISLLFKFWLAVSVLNSWEMRAACRSERQQLQGERYLNVMLGMKGPFKQADLHTAWLVGLARDETAC